MRPGIAAQSGDAGEKEFAPSALTKPIRSKHAMVTAGVDIIGGAVAEHGLAQGVGFAFPEPTVGHDHVGRPRSAG